MLEALPIPYDVDALAWALAGTIVALAAAARLHSTDRWWCPELAWFWTPLRKYALPPLDVALDNVPLAFAKSTVYENEVVAEDLDVTMDELREDLAGIGAEKQPLASLATFDDSSEKAISGMTERGSYAIYYGDRVGGDLTRGLPDWLVCKRQAHPRPFGPDGSITLTGHAEYNPWCLPYSLPHLLAIGFDPEEGVAKIQEELDLDAETVEKPSS